jgi:hypothetical protein
MSQTAQELAERDGKGNRLIRPFWGGTRGLVNPENDGFFSFSDCFPGRAYFFAVVSSTGCSRQ